MDSTNPPQQQQQPHNPSSTQQQQQQQQHQQQQQQQQPHHQPPPPPQHQHPQQHHHQRPQIHPQHPQPPTFAPSQYPPQRSYLPPQYAYQPAYPPQQYYPNYMYNPAPQAWQPSPANHFPAQQAQPTLANMVNTQPQSNVPQQQQQQQQPQQQQQHNKSSHVGSDRRPQNSTVQTANVPNSRTSTITNPKKLAILKNPKTGEIVPLLQTDNNSTSTTKTTNPVTKPSPNVDPNVTTLLQKVSEEVKEENKENADKIKTEKCNSQQNEQKQQPKQQAPSPPQHQPKQQQQQIDKAKTEQVEKVVEKNDKSKESEQPKQHNGQENSRVEKVQDTKPMEAKVEQKQQDVKLNVGDKKKVEEKQNEQQNGEANASSSNTADSNAAPTTTPTPMTTVVAPTGEDGEVKKESDGDDGEEKGEKKEEESNPLSLLTYAPGQYNPISNTEGKRIYSKQFLLDVCEKIVKIDPSLPESSPMHGGEGNQSSAFTDRVDPFAPSFSSSRSFNAANRQNDPSRRQSQQNYAGRSSAGQERQRKIITSVSLTQEVELKTTSNPWRPTKDIKEDLPVDELESESLKKKFRSILNKLTPNNFESLASSVTELNIDTESKLGDVIDIVFAKALAEPGYCVLYGQMCSHLKKISAGQANFGNTLIKRCQLQFQADIYADSNVKEVKEKIEAEKDPEVKKQLEEELYEIMYRCRMRGLGLIKFIGELYKIEMLNDKIMLDCVYRLKSDVSEESLECLCDLLATIGEKLDRSTSQKNNEKEKKAPKSASKANAYTPGQKSLAEVLQSNKAAAQPRAVEQQQSLDQVFEELHKIRKNKDLDLSLRIRFKILDTCELREKDNWQSKKTREGNPKKIDEIREAHKVQLEQERQQNAMGPRRSQEGRRLGHSGGSSSQISSMGAESGGGYRGQSNMHTSSSSHLIRDHSIGDNMKSNHDDIESQKEHQKKLESMKNFAFLKNTGPAPVSIEGLRPRRFLQKEPN